MAVVEPTGTRTLEGTVATAVLVLDNVTDIPVVGAGPLSVTVAVERLPPLTLGGFRVKEETPGAVTVNR